MRVHPDGIILVMRVTRGYGSSSARRDCSVFSARKQKEMNAGTQLSFSVFTFHSAQDPSPWVVSLTFRAGLLSSINSL